MLRIRSITAPDWPAYRSSRLRALQDAPQAFGSTWAHENALPPQEWQARCTASESGQSGRGFFVVDGQEVCGLAWCLLDDTDPETAHVYAMWVAPAIRGQGAGRALLHECIVWALSKGVRQVQLSVSEGQSSALQLYASQGFYPVGSDDALRPGSDVRARQMKLDLPKE